ncbi:MAG: MBL fold metallo-hydrolase [Clostridiales bacterium]|jgi:glyoxylase-like metal-dependent hydrolase (beta-lactamase superfamily II)|nr:MBL fold metallo-hydrolase [Clostridiales bacterium]
MSYFKTREYGDGVHMLWETLGVGSFLIVGVDKALLIDTGYGFGDIAAAASEIAKKPIIVVNSHVHPDHSMGNNQFERVLIGAGDMWKLEDGALQSEYEEMIGFAASYFPPLKLIVKHNEKIPKSTHCQTEYAPLAAGDAIDLGGRVIEAVEMPGHTRGSVVFLDRAAKTVFAGDAVNRGMFLFIDKDLKLARYAERLDKLAELKGFSAILTSHSTKPLSFSFVKYYADFLLRAVVPKRKPSPMPLSEKKVCRYSEKSREYGDVSVFFYAGQEREA